MGENMDGKASAGTDRVRRQLVVGLCIVALLGAGVIVTGLRFRHERTRAASPTIAGSELKDGVILQATVVLVDPAKNEMTVSVLAAPQGSFGKFGWVRPLTIVTGTSSGLTQTDIKAGSPITATDVKVALTDSQVAEYPFDNYNARLEFLIATPSDGVPDGAAPSDSPSIIAVPTQVGVESVLQGYKIVATPNVARTSEFTSRSDTQTCELFQSRCGEASHVTASFEVSRSGSTQFFAVFVMVLMWAISIGLLWICLSVLFRRRRLEVTILSLFGIVLFALPNIRNVQPNAPPIGSLTDVLAFFWCESLVAACLVALIIVFVRRGTEPAG